MTTDYEYAKECVDNVSGAWRAISEKIRAELSVMEPDVIVSDAEIEEFIAGMKDHYGDLFAGKLDSAKEVIDDYEAAEARAFRNDNRTY